MVSVITLALLASAGTARAGIELGVGADIAQDLSDDALPEARAEFGPGLSLRLPVRVGLAEGGALRLSPRFLRASGTDTMTWPDPDSDLIVASTDHPTTLTGLELGLGPELRLGAARDAALQPYLGASIGLGYVGLRHTMSGAAAEALTGQDKETVLSASQVGLSSGAHLGLRYAPISSFALEVEAGYNVSFLSEVAVLGVTEVEEASVAAFGLNALRVGLGATFSFGDGTVR